LPGREPGEPPSRNRWSVRSFLADRYHESGRHAEALELIWAEFSEHPGLERYRLLRRHAEVAGDCPAWRQRRNWRHTGH